MKLRNIVRIALLLSTALLFLTFASGKSGVHPVPIAHAQDGSGLSHCQPIGGTVMTNLGVVDQSTTLGVVSGDLQGSLAATILNVEAGPNGTSIFTVQHHFVTPAADIILVDQATATTKEVVPASGLYASDPAIFRDLAVSPKVDLQFTCGALSTLQECARVPTLQRRPRWSQAG